MDFERFGIQSRPSRLDEARARLWEMPVPTTREQYLERKDLKREIDTMAKEDYMNTHKAGYAAIMKLRGQTREEIE